MWLPLGAGTAELQARPHQGLMAQQLQHPPHRLLCGAGRGGSSARPSCKSCTSVIHTTRGTLAPGTYGGTCGDHRSADGAGGVVGGRGGDGLADDRSDRGGGQWRGSHGRRGRGDKGGGDGGHDGGGGGDGVEGCAPSRRTRGRREGRTGSGAKTSIQNIRANKSHKF